MIRRFLLYAVLFLSGAAVAFGQEGLVAHYTFSGNFADSSSNHFNAIPFGDAKIVYDSLRNENVVDLDGTTGTYVRLGNDTLFNWHGGWTASFWVYLRSWNGVNWCTLLKKNNAWSFERNVSADQLAFYSWPNFAPTSVPLAPDGQWHHVAATMDGQTQNLYLDGLLFQSVKSAGQFATDTDAVILGSEGGTDRFADARFADVRLYDVALTTSQIQKLAGYTPPPSPLVARYTFNGTYADSSNNGLDAKPYGNAALVYDPVKEGTVLSLDGTNGTYVDFGNDTLFNWQGSWTAAFWVKLRNWNSGGWATLLKKSDSYSFERNVTQDTLAFYQWPNFAPTVAKLLPDSTWHYVAATLDGSTQKLYMDGALVASVPNAGNFATDTNHVILGSADGTSRFVNASFSDVRFYNVALSASDIRQLAGAPPIVGDVALFHFNGNFNNDAATGDTITPHGKVTFVNGLPGKGKAIYLDNSAATDSSYLSFPDMTELNITGSMTIQGWFSYADTAATPWNNAAYLVSKIDPTARPNYYVMSNLSGTASLRAGYTSVNQGNSVPDPAVTDTLSSQAAFLNHWYHFVYQRDSVLRVVSLAILDTGGNIVSFGFRQSHPAYDMPQTSTATPLLIGRSRTNSNNFFNGYLDDIEISNVAEPLDLPPVIVYPHYLTDPVYSEKIGNQDVSLSQYPVSVYIKVLGNPNGVASAKIRYHVVTDPYEKVAVSDSRWTDVPMTKGSGDLWTGYIPKQPLATVIDYYISATSTTGRTTTVGANPDSVYDRFGVWRQHDMVLKLSFEQTDLNFIDSTVYKNELNKLGNWVVWDDPTSQIEGHYCAYLPQGGFGVGEIISPFLSLEQFTVTAWLKPVPNAMLHNTYVISMTAGSYDKSIPMVTDATHPWPEQNYTFLQRYTEIKDDINHDNRWPDEVTYQGDLSFVHEDTLGEWSHYLISCGPDSLVVQRNNSLDQPVERQVFKGPTGTGWEHPFMPFVPSIGRFRIGPPGPPDGDPFYSGYIDDIEVYNYQTLPGNFANPLTGIVENSTSVPTRYELYQNYPNPFNPTTTIRFAVAHKGKVSLVVYNVLGQKVATLVEANKDPGTYSVRFNASDLASGVYFYRFVAGTYVKVKKLMLLK